MPESQTPAAPSTPAADPAATPSTPPAAPTPPVAPPAAPATPAAPTVDPAAEQRATAAEQAAQQAKTERDELLAGLRRVLDPNGAAAEQDPAALAAQATTERDQAQAEVRRLRVELAAHQAAHGAGADPARLLDSRAVERQLSDLDPDDAKFGDKLAAVITAAVEASPHLRAEGTPAGPPQGGADFTPGSTPTPTADQFARMSYGERVELHQSDPDLYARLSAASE
ncbi:hypothetical protein [Streptomyces rapamycinicus]|uniref:hypothetical protein n=1 Tax=Streptomyces rapamycinicus TaxID=1226757 RepID=UPI0020C9F8A7|nr:hypothetical protein [Streptomyces rapamycinicus]UTP32709.1 hypothetical protein LIV37_27220 [Streptomyces rapamycinicus NRRL 5491]